jgi:ankyrin repeat protein
MANTNRIEWFFSRAGLHPPPRLTRLTEPAAQDFLPFETTNRDLARQLLVQQRTTDPNFTPPERQKRHIFRSKDQKAEACNTTQWSFTKHEVAQAFDTMISRQTLPPAGVAQALLLHTTLTSLDELWGHFNDPQLEKKMKRQRMSSNPTGFGSQGMTWLDKAIDHENFNYILLLCQTQVSQYVLDRAFGIALSKSSLQAMKILLSFGAKATTYQESIDQQIQARNLDLVGLLLSAPGSMTTELWETCLEQEFVRAKAGEAFSLSFVLLLLSNCPGLVSESTLLSTLRLQNFQATAVVLAYAHSNEIFFSIRHQASELVSCYEDANHRMAFFTLLSESGLVSDNLILREELVKDVLARHLLLVKLLVQAGVIIDAPPHNALHWAVGQLDFEMMEILKHGTFSSPPVQILSYLPENIPEEDMIQFLKVFGHMSLAGRVLDFHLVHAVQQEQIDLAGALLQCGASVETEQGAVIHAALTSNDLDMLSLLLRVECSPAIISAAIPRAMGIVPRPNRLSAMRALVTKGVESSALGAALHELMREDGSIDSELVKFILDHGAPLGHTTEVEESPFVQATTRGDVLVLKLLLDANPDHESLAAALAIAYNTIETLGNDVALVVMALLLEKGASGSQVHQTLLKATSDTRVEFVRLLIEHGADVNYSSGEAFAQAAKMQNTALLELLCSSSPPSQETVDTVLPKLIDPELYNLITLELFLNAVSRSFPRPSLSSAYPLIEQHPQFAEILPCLLRHGLDINGEDGAVLRLVVKEQDLQLVDAVLALDPDVATLCNAFNIAFQIETTEVKLEIMRKLLDKKSPADIGQSKALLQETQIALNGSMDGLWLLLGHKANVNFNTGEAIQAAASHAAGYPIILNMLLSAGASSTTVEAAFKAASGADTSPTVKLGVFGSLFAFNKEISVEVVSRALAKVLEMHPEDNHLPGLLLEHGARIDLPILKAAADALPGGIFQRLICRIDDFPTRSNIFQYVRDHVTMGFAQKQQAYTTLLKQGVDQSRVSDALIDTIKNDPDNLELPKLLLDHGAQLSHGGNIAFTTAFNFRNLKLVELLCSYLKKGEHDAAAKLVFEHPYLRDNPSVDPTVRASIYRSVIPCNIDKKDLYRFLVHTLESRSADLTIVRLLLENGAEPNDEEGHCFYLAARNKLDPYFRALCKYADLSIVLPTLLRRFDKETHVTRWFRIYFEVRKLDGENEVLEQLLFQCIRKFKDGDMLLGLLLDMGLSTAAKTNYHIRNEWPQEEITLLMWAIISPLKISNTVVLRLLEEGQAGKFGISSPKMTFADKHSPSRLRHATVQDTDSLLRSLQQEQSTSFESSAQP